MAEAAKKRSADRHVTVKVADLRTTFYVRVKPDDDRMQMFAELYENGIPVPPIEVAEVEDEDGIHFETVDGRHRKGGLEVLADLHKGQYIETECIVKEFDSTEDMIVYALRANTGGALPPTSDDFEHTIRLLQAQGLTPKRIMDLLDQKDLFGSMILARPIVRRYLNDIASKEAKVRLRKAVLAVTDHKYTVPRAAREFTVKEQTLRDELRGKKTDKSAETKFTFWKKDTAMQCRVLTQKNVQRFKKVIEAVEDGELNEGIGRLLFEEALRALKRVERSTLDWQARFEASVKAGKAGITLTE